MCTEVEVWRGSHVIRCKTIAQLTDALDGNVVGSGGWPGNVCLCPVDIEATAAKFGFDTDEIDHGVIAFRERTTLGKEVSK